MQEQKNHFYPVIKKFLTTEIESNNLIDILLKIEAKLNADGNYELSSKEFSVVGAISYFVGIDYINQTELNKTVCDTVYARFKDVNISEEVSKAFLKTVTKIGLSNFEKAAEELHNKCEKTIKFDDDKLSVHFKTFVKPKIKNIINNSIVTVESAIIIDSILTRPEMTYIDLITLNSIFTKQVTFNGEKAIKNYVDLYNNAEFVSLLMKASLKFDMKKYSTIYYDSVLSVNESIVKFDAETLEKVITGNIENIDFELINENLKVKKTPSIDEYENISDEIKEKIKAGEESISEGKKLMESNPIKFIVDAILTEQLGKKPELVGDIVEAWDKVLNNQDYAQHIYNYCKVKGVSNNKTKEIQIDAESDEDKALFLTDTIVYLNNTILDYAESYKTNSELICAEIPSDKISKIRSLVNDCISVSLIETEEQKEYLITEYLESGITTYLHITQIVSLLETLKMQGSEINAYIALHKLIVSDDIMADIFKNKVSENQDLEYKLQVYKGLLEFYTSFLKK